MRVTCLLAVWVCGSTTAGAAHAQEVTGWGLGFTLSNMVESFPSGSSRGNTMRRFVSVWAASHLGERGPLHLDAGLRFVAKGFEVSGPTIHSEYLEVPVSISLGPETGPFFAVGSYVGLRIHCSRWARTRRWGTVHDGCGRTESPLDWRPLRRWDLGAQVDLGIRRGDRAGGTFALGAGIAWSLVDVDPEESGRRRNEVLAVWMAFEFPR